MQRFPNTVDDLIAALDKTFPEPAIQADDTMDKIKFDAGQRSVVTYLKRWRANPQQERPTMARGEGRPTR